MKTVTKTYYLFDELADNIKQKVIEKNYDINVNYDWWDYTYEDAEQIGLKITGFDIGYRNTITGDLTEAPEKVIALILENHGESCKTYTIVKEYQADLKAGKEKYASRNDKPQYTEYEDTEPYQNLANNLKQALLQEYLIILREEHEYCTSDEAIMETLRSNEYYFEENGKPE